MAVQSFSDAHAQLYQGQKNAPKLASPISGGVSSFQQSHTQLMQDAAAKPKQAQITPPHIKTATPAPKQQPSPIQNAWDTFTNFIAKIPEAPQLKAGITSPIPQKQMLPQARKAVQGSSFDNAAANVGNFAGGMVNSMSGAEAGRATKSLTQNVEQRKSTPQQVVGDVATIGMFLANFLTGGGGSVVKQGVVDVAKTPGVKNTIVQVGKTIGKDAIIGGGFGILSGLSSGKDINNVNDYVTNLWNNVKTGVEFGAGAGTVLHGGTAIVKPVVKNVVLPLAKGASSKMGALFVKNVDKNPVIAHMQLDPKIAQSTVLGNDELANSSAGKAIIKNSYEATQTGDHVGITPNPHGAYSLPSGQKVDVAIVPEYKPGAFGTVLGKQPDLNIKPSVSDLSLGDRSIESNFATYLNHDYQGAVERYNALPDTVGGRVLSTDTAKELNASYNQDRSKTMAVQQPASAFIKQLYKDKLKEPIVDGKDTVVFTAGGTGAGKTTGISTIPEIKEIHDNAQFVYDTNSANPERGITQIQQAVDAGRNVMILYTHRDPVVAYEKGVLPRAMEQGRTVTTDVHLKTHLGALASIIKIADHFKDNPHVAVEVIDNTREKGEAHVVPLDNLREMSYNKAELHTKLNENLQRQYETNQISDKVYNASKGKSESNIVSTESTHNGASSSKESQREINSTTKDTGNAHATTDESSENTNGSNTKANKLQTSNTGPLDNTRKNPEEFPKATKEYDAKGKEIGTTNKKVLTGNQVKAIRDVIVAKLEQIRQTAQDEEHYGKGIDTLVTDIEERSGGDKQVLSALRTELNQEMYGLVGKSGNYKEDYKNLQELKSGDSPMGNLITKIDTHIGKLDNQLLATPDKKYEAPAFVKERQQKQTGFKGASEPVGTGGPKQSRAYKRLVEHLQEEKPDVYEKIKDDPKLLYNTVNQEYDFEKAAKLVADNPQKAYNIAKQFEPAPVGQRWESVNIVLADKALDEGNIALWKDLEQSRSLAQTRAGQGIVAERGRFDEASPHAYVQKVLDARLQKLGGGNLTDAIKLGASKVGKVTRSAKENAFAKIDHVVERAQKFTAKERNKINFAQKLLDELTCK